MHRAACGLRLFWDMSGCAPFERERAEVRVRGVEDDGCRGAPLAQEVEEVATIDPRPISRASVLERRRRELPGSTGHVFYEALHLLDRSGGNEENRVRAVLGNLNAPCLIKR